MKNLYIHGHFMSDNYGDFLLFYYLINIVEKYKNKYNWYSTDIDKSYDNYCKINRVDIKYAIKNSDLVIFSGGGYFGESPRKRLKWNIKCFIKHIYPAYKFYKKNIPYIIIGVEVGPISSFINRILLKKIFNGAKIVSVRNEESKLFLEKLNVKNKIEVNPDCILGVNEEIFPLDNIDVNDIIDKNKKNIFVHLTSNIDAKGLKNVIDDLKKYQIINKNIRYIFGSDQESIYQRENVKKIFDIFNENYNIVSYYKNPWYLTKVIKNVDAVITDKLHVGIVATMLKKEVICVAKDTKSIRFYNLIGRNEYVSLMKNVKKNDILEMLNKIKFKNININVDILKKSKNNRKLIEQFLNEN